ncbi:MAG: hypothetical protein GC181_00025 [Bacteroidetes bacterium]|nr:hypothetical protein [Bacteroidota bacterium]
MFGKKRALFGKAKPLFGIKEFFIQNAHHEKANDVVCMYMSYSGSFPFFEHTLSTCEAESFEWFVLVPQTITSINRDKSNCHSTLESFSGFFG